MIWVEILSRHREVTSRFRIAAAEVSIGRGYDNDVVIDDPYVAARHLRVSRNEAGQLVAEDLGSKNGTFVYGKKDRVTRLAVNGGEALRIGQTLLRFRALDHAVEPERIAQAEARGLPIVVIAALAAVLGLVVLRVWLAQTGEPRLSSYLTPELWTGGSILVWVGIWALLSRIFAGRSKFLRNLMIALTAVLVSELYTEFARYAAFGLTWPQPSNYEYASVWLILAGAVFMHLREISATALLTKGAVVTALSVLAISAQTLQRSEAFSDLGRQNNARLLLPPAFRTVPLHAPDTFFADVAGLKATLDNDRRLSKPGEATH